MTTPEDLFADYLDPEEPDPNVDAESALALDRVRGALNRPELWDGPSAGARDKLMALAAHDPPDFAPHTARRTPAALRLWGGVVSGAVAAALVLLVLLPAFRETPGTSFDLAGSPYSPDAAAVAIADERGNGVAFSLAVDGLPAAPPGTYYAAWVMGEAGMVSVGTFHNRAGDAEIELWSGVSAADYPMFMVTIQNEGEPILPPGAIALQGRVPIDG